MEFKKLSILHINNFHYLRGGSEAVYFGTADILEEHGNKSIFFSMSHPENLPCETSNYFVPYVDLCSNDNKSIITWCNTAGRILYFFEAKRRLSALLDKYHIDIAHLHNIYHELSPSVIDVLKERKIPMVMTLHDYKMVCTSYSMLAEGKPCEACSQGRYYHAIRKRCVKGAFAMSMLATLEAYLHNSILNIYDKVDIFISPSLFLKNKLEEMGFKKEIIYLPNFIDMKRFEKIREDKNPPQETSVVYFGRLSPEKGLWTLLEAAKRLKIEKNELEIKIVGDGIMRGILEEKVKTEGINNVKFLGYIKGEALYKEINRSIAVVLPSECYENNPVSVLEAFALGKPVIGSRIGGIPELVIDGVSGYTFEPNNAEDLKSKILFLMKNKNVLHNMSKNTRELLEKNFNEEVYCKGLMSIYENVLAKYGN